LSRDNLTASNVKTALADAQPLAYARCIGPIEFKTPNCLSVTELDQLAAIWHHRPIRNIRLIDEQILSLP